MQPISLQQTAQRLAQGREAAVQRKKRLQGEEARYTTILHSARRQLELSVVEYCLADTVHKLSGTHSAVPGWCYASKEQLAYGLSLTRQSIHNMIRRLKEKEILEAHPETGHLRTTALWRDTVEVLKARVFAD